MSFDADAIVDRRRLRRKLTFWRVAAFTIAAVLLAGAFVSLVGFGGPSKRSAHIARIEIGGVIVDDRKRIEMIEKLSENDAVKGVVLSVNSPGGSTTGGESLYEALRNLADKKPMATIIGTLGASAGYMTAVAADHVIARHNSLTGSIGVYIQYGNIKGLLDTLGIEFDVVKSGPLKAQPNFFQPTTDAARQNLQAVIDDSYNWFVKIVAERRKMDEGKVRDLANGGIYSGIRAQSLGLVDAVGGEKDATDWLVEERGVPADLPVITWSSRSELEELPFASRMAAAVGQGLSHELFNRLDGAKHLVPAGVSLDGLVSVWHAPEALNNNDTIGADR